MEGEEGQRAEGEEQTCFLPLLHLLPLHLHHHHPHPQPYHPHHHRVCIWRERLRKKTHQRRGAYVWGGGIGWQGRKTGHGT